MIISIGGTPEKVPDFLIVGAPRTGTTFVFDSLIRHPRVHAPREKEPSFFYAWGESPRYEDPRRKLTADYITYRLEDYLRLFRGAKEGQLMGEASASYLYFHERTIPNLRKIYGQDVRALKIIMILRNPADRAWSHYWYKRSFGTEALDFDEAIRPEVIRTRLDAHLSPGFDYLGMSRYSRGVEAFLGSFDRVKILIFEEMVRDLPGAIARLFEFLGLPDVKKGDVSRATNKSGLPRPGLAGLAARLAFRPNPLKSIAKPLLPRRLRQDWKRMIGEKGFVSQKMDEAARARLLAGYEEDIRRLEKLLGRDLQVWRRPRPNSRPIDKEAS